MRNITIKGARVHNLKNIDVTIPRNSFTVITGLSGSGKSSLAFDTLYSESQRRYVESLSSYARQFLGVMEKPDVEQIEGLSPAIAIEQKSTSHNPRSTVGTITEIHDYLRILFARLGTATCFNCGRIITNQTVQEITDKVLTLPEGTKFQILSPIIKERKGEHKETLAKLQKEGFLRIRVDGEILSLDEDIEIDPKRKHTIEVVVDRLISRPDLGGRLSESLETALKVSVDKTVLVDCIGAETLLFSEQMNCPVCGISYEEISPRMFSFNSPTGACSECHGLGFLLEIDPELVVPDNSRSLAEGAIVPWNGANTEGSWNYQILQSVCKHFKISVNVPFQQLTPKQRKILLYGAGKERIPIQYKAKNGDNQASMKRNFEGVIPNLLRRYRETSSEEIRRWIEGFMTQKTCPQCAGTRLKKESLSILINDHSIADISRMPVERASEFFKHYSPSGEDQKIARPVLREITERLTFLLNVGLGYLNLERTSSTLSGGEAQRIRLATQIGSSLSGVLYVLDEPSIGLHPRDNSRLLSTLVALRDLENTVVVIEHDLETMLAADYLIDIGPRAGAQGGELIACGSPSQVAQKSSSLTGQYLSGKRKIPIPPTRRSNNNSFIEIKGASGHNLKDIEVKIPLKKLVCITGVSGSGKSSLINQTLYPAISKKLYRSKRVPLPYKMIKGLEEIDKVIDIDQSPIGKTPRSNPATYTKVFDPIRNLFAMLPESKIRGYSPGRFSFNVKGGRCEACEGDGVLKIEMHFLPDVYVQCETCKGKRYNRETLEVLYKGKSIADVLEMTVDEALIFFDKIHTIKTKLSLLSEVGLGYIHLGQPANTLSGGEAQRIKLASELAKRATGNTLYILDEPTTGLHLEDILMLMNVVQELVNKGNSVLIIEHNLDVIKCADYIIDLGPEGGDKGGTIVAKGSPEEIIKNESSITGKYLKPYIETTVS
ncbi:excinuclease ABC subunit UvrA [Chitinispirillales bacterium ANBcel5]|uniref:excinuclease ABC subunit UvrA n=1 Tax=Cellulosispirillum alkaliphilum TaxID=3039283 RepID=UPI002A57B477|nr:excinuclease ABC subunit UvrA [Chitinispirillales bacterium ANBcel5]